MATILALGGATTLAAASGCTVRECVYFNDCGAAMMCTEQGTCVPWEGGAGNGPLYIAPGAGQPMPTEPAAEELAQTGIDVRVDSIGGFIGTEPVDPSAVTAFGQLFDDGYLSVWVTQQVGLSTTFFILDVYDVNATSGMGPQSLQMMETASILTCSDGDGDGYTELDVGGAEGTVVVTPIDEGAAVLLEVNGLVDGTPGAMGAVLEVQMPPPLEANGP